MLQRCIVCDSAELVPLVKTPDAPVLCNVVSDTREQALLAPRAALDIVVCEACGHIFNVTFDPAIAHYDGDYENSLYGSALFREYSEALSDRLVAEYALHGKDIVEIGCGDGRFLETVCRKGANRGFGFDPASRPRRHGEGGEEVCLFAELYDRDTSFKGDMVLCRHVLEHIAGPGDFIDLLRSALKDASAVLYIEVPDGLYTLSSGLIWDLTYEHCSYFCATSLARLLRRRGFTVHRLDTAYGDQFLAADARPGHTEGHMLSRPLPETLVHIRGFAPRFHAAVEGWRRRIAAAAAEGATIVAWGAGSKGVTFLNLADWGVGAIDHIVDVNPEKIGKFVAGTGQEIIAPETLTQIRPDLVLLMNPLYLAEVQGQLASLGLFPAVEVVEGDQSPLPWTVGGARNRGADAPDRAKRAGGKWS